MHKIFISYSRQDYAAVVQLKDEIESLLGYGSCWIDLIGIESDRQFVDVIIDAIDKAVIFLFMYSKHSENSVWTRKEINYANSEKKRIVFLKIDDAEISKYYRFQFGGHDIIDIEDKKQKKKLLNDLTKWCGLVSPNQEQEQNQEQEPSMEQEPEQDFELKMDFNSNMAHNPNVDLKPKMNFKPKLEINYAKYINSISKCFSKNWASFTNYVSHSVCGVIIKGCVLMAILAFAFLFLGWSAVFILASLVFGVLWYSDEIQNKYPKVGKYILTIRSWSTKFLLGLNSLFSIFWFFTTWGDSDTDLLYFYSCILILSAALWLLMQLKLIDLGIKTKKEKIAYFGIFVFFYLFSFIVTLIGVYFKTTS